MIETCQEPSIQRVVFKMCFASLSFRMRRNLGNSKQVDQEREISTKKQLVTERERERENKETRNQMTVVNIGEGSGGG